MRHVSGIPVKSENYVSFRGGLFSLAILMLCSIAVSAQTSDFQANL